MKIGFLINPIAGMGGRVGLKGTDNVVEIAIRRGAKQIAPLRARDFLAKLYSSIIQNRLYIDIISCRMNMGEDVLKLFDFPSISYIDIPKSRNTTAVDTQNAAKKFAESNVDIIVFVGGDGTARDVYYGLMSANKEETPILGVPSGVKIYSGLFAVTPEDAAHTLIEYIKGTAKLMDLEILDIDEEAFRNDRINIKIYAYAKTPYIPFYIQFSKQSSPDTIDEIDNQNAIAKYIVEMIDENAVYILGPGTTVKRVADMLGIKKTVLGVDIYYKGRVYNDLSEKDILNLINNKKDVWIIVTPIGRQGIIFGRGNQQISPEVIKRVGKDKIIVIATRRKLGDIPEGILRVDTQDVEVNNMLRGYIRVIIDYRTWRMIEVK